MSQIVETNPKISKDHIILALLILVFVLVVTLLIMHRHKQDLPKDDKVLQDSISLLLKQIDSSHIRQARLESNYNTLLNSDPKIIYSNHEKTKFIFNTASPTQLDSIIRTNWSKQRHY